MLRAHLDEALARLERQESQLRDFSGLLGVGIWEWDEAEGRPISYSSGMAAIFGLEPGQFESLCRSIDDFENLVHHDDRARYREENRSADLLKSGEAHIYEYRIITPAGDVRRIREYEIGVFDEHGKLLSSHGLVQDITETHNMIAALRESEERYSSLFDQMPLGVQEEDYSEIKLVVDRLQSRGVYDLESYLRDNDKLLRELVGRTHITNINQALLRIHQAESKAHFLAAESDINTWWDDDWARFYAAEIAALASDEHYYEVEHSEARADGTSFENRSISTLVHGFEDTWERVITIQMDVTDRKRAEAQLIEAKNQAELASQAKSDFLSSMSHELRTPLNAILGFSQLFAYDPGLDEQHRTSAAEINRAGRHLMSLIDQILELSRIEAGDNELALEPVAIGPVLSDCLTWVLPLAGEHEIDIEFDATAFDGVRVAADGIRLKQIFLNLLSNAIKYNRPQGKVFIGLGPCDDDRVRVSVRDTGVGISEERQQELFQPFNRLGAELSGIEGTGIGLVITRRLLDMMRGDLEVESSTGDGSDFRVVLRRSGVEAEAESSREHAVESAFRYDDGPGRRIVLVAEDNLINQELIKAQLELMGLRAELTEDGRQALDLWRRGDYLMLLTDIRMPRLDGYSLIREIRSAEARGMARKPLIAITANAMQADIDKCLRAGADAVLSKPVDFEKLCATLGQWMPAAQGAAADVPAAPSPPPPAADTDLDLQILAQATGGQPARQPRLLGEFAAALPAEAAFVKQAHAWKNCEQIGETCHKLKSSARGIGAIPLGAVCERLEKAAGTADWPLLDALMPEFLHRVELAGEAIAAWLRDQPPAQQVEDGDAEPSPAPGGDSDAAEDDSDDTTQFSLKLLLVDDDYAMHRITTVILNDLGITKVFSAMSGPEALKLLDKHGDRVDVVLCDLNMPGMDGVEFIRYLARRKYRGSLILTSGEDLRILKTVEKLAIEHELRVLGVFEKPATPAKLSELLDGADQIDQCGTLRMGEAVTLSELTEAIRGGRLDTWFQPKLEVVSRRVVGVEALVRWQHPQKGMIRPSTFVSMAEEQGLIGELTDLVCNKALQYGSRLRRHGHGLGIAINISVDSLTDLAWPDRISDQLRRWELAPADVSFEVTESRLMDRLSVALDILSRLSLKRYNLSIDDFGTGYSSMEQLQRIPFTELKIDRAFVRGASRDTLARAILESNVLLAKKLDMKIVAEGVETREDWDLVAGVGCDQVQGFIVSKPLPFDRLLRWLDEFDGDKMLPPP